MDFQIKSSVGRAFTASTNQLDLYMGKQFGLEYVDSDGERKVPAIIHRAPLGTHERFIGFLIEHFAGNFPLWLSPVQAVVIPIGEAHHEYAQEVFERFKNAGIRVGMRDDNESLGKKIRESKLQKIPYLIVVGGQEVESKTLTLESRDQGKIGTLAIEETLAKLREEIASKAILEKK